MISSKSIMPVGFMVVLLLMVAAVANAQTTTGTVTMSGTTSKFVELNSGGAVTLSGNVGGGVTTDGTVNSPLAVVINLGELGPSNTASFVKAVVPLKLRSNAAYILSMSATVTGSAATANRLTAADIGFGLGGLTRTGTGVATGTDTNQTAGDPTTLAVGDATTNATTGRWEYLATKSDLADFAASTPALNGPQIMNAVPRTNTNGLVVNSIFAVKPQFYENGTTSVAVTFTATAP